MAEVRSIAGRAESPVPFQQQAVRQGGERRQDVREQRQSPPESIARNNNTIRNRDIVNINRPAERQIARAQSRNQTVVEQQIRQEATPRERGGVPQDRQAGNIDLFA